MVPGTIYDRHNIYIMELVPKTEVLEQPQCNQVYKGALADFNVW
jgi:hypothetical protein